jgi:hypothetical protein
LEGETGVLGKDSMPVSLNAPEIQNDLTEDLDGRGGKPVTVANPFVLCVEQSTTKKLFFLVFIKYLRYESCLTKTCTPQSDLLYHVTSYLYNKLISEKMHKAQFFLFL